MIYKTEGINGTLKNPKSTNRNEIILLNDVFNTFVLKVVSALVIIMGLRKKPSGSVMGTELRPIT